MLQEGKAHAAPRIWADEEEKEQMMECHAASIEFMKKELGKLELRKRGRALDVASGAGKLT